MTYRDDAKLIDSFAEVTLTDDQNFLKIKETLTRVGISASTAEDAGSVKRLIQSCHILHKRGRYFIVHFKELYLLDGREETVFSENDLARRNTIVTLLAEWGLLKAVKAEALEPKMPMDQIKVISFADKKNYVLEAKYAIGRPRRR